MSGTCHTGGPPLLKGPALLNLTIYFIEIETKIFYIFYVPLTPVGDVLRRGCDPGIFGEVPNQVVVTLGRSENGLMAGYFKSSN
jgi:hypothetical protein